MILVVRQAGVRGGLVYARLGDGDLGGAAQVGVDPIVVGLAMGLLTYAYPAARGRPRARDRSLPALPRAADAGARTEARAGLRSAISPNERLQQLYHPWTSYVIVPLFALANAGIVISGGFLSHAYTSPDHARRPHRLRRRQAGRDRGHRLARHDAEPRAAAAAGRLGRRRRRGRDRGDRLHGLDPDRDARLPRRAARGGEARRAVGRARRVARDLARVPRGGAAAAGGCGSARCSALPSRSSISRTRSTPSAITSAGRRRRR